MPQGRQKDTPRMPQGRPKDAQRTPQGRHKDSQKGRSKDVLMSLSITFLVKETVSVNCIFSQRDCLFQSQREVLYIKDMIDLLKRGSLSVVFLAKEIISVNRFFTGPTGPIQS